MGKKTSIRGDHTVRSPRTSAAATGCRHSRPARQQLEAGTARRYVISPSVKICDFDSFLVRGSQGLRPIALLNLGKAETSERIIRGSQGLRIMKRASGIRCAFVLNYAALGIRWIRWAAGSASADAGFSKFSVNAEMASSVVQGRSVSVPSAFTMDRV